METWRKKNTQRLATDERNQFQCHELALRSESDSFTTSAVTQIIAAATSQLGSMFFGTRNHLNKAAEES